MPNRYLTEVSIPFALLEVKTGCPVILKWANEAWLIVTDMVANDCIGHPVDRWMDLPAYTILSEQLELITQDASGARFVLPMRPESGECIFDAVLHTVPGQSNKRDYTQVMLTLQDLTQEHQMRQQLMLQDQEHRRMVEHMEQFMSFAAHDLRSPMRNVQLLADLLREDFVDHGDGKVEMIDLLHEIGAKAATTINDLLEYSRSATLSETMSVCQMTAIKTDVDTLLNPQNLHDLHFRDASVETDPVVLRIILQNLVDNAIKHSGLTHVNVYVDVRALHNEMLEFSVRNSGGAVANPATLFLETKDFRCDSGFGLYGIERLISERGGKIESLPPKSGTGAEFRFQIPGRLAVEHTIPMKMTASR